MNKSFRRLYQEFKNSSPIIRLARVVEVSREVERMVRGDRVVAECGIPIEKRDQLIMSSGETGSLALDKICITRAVDLVDVVPQLGAAYARVQRMLASPNSAPLREDLKAIRFALSSALVVVDLAIPASQVRCGYLVDDAAKVGFDLG